MKKLICVALLTATFSFPGYTQQGTGRVIGFGAQLCGHWIEDRAMQARSVSNNQTHEYLAWVQGMLTGLNVARFDKGTKMLTLPDMNTVSVLMDQECAKDPLLQMAVAASNTFDKIAAHP